MKNNLIKTLSLCMILSSSIATFVMAEEVNLNKPYIFVEGGLSKAASKAKYYPINKKFKDSSMFGGGLGYRVNDYFRAELAINYRPNFSYKASGDSVHHSQKVKSFNTMINVYYDINQFSNMFTPYVTAGLGFARNKAGNFTSTLAGDTIAWSGKTKNNFAWQAGVGALVKVDTNIDLNFGYRFVNLGKVTTKNTTVFGLALSANKAKLSAHEFIAGISYKF